MIYMIVNLRIFNLIGLAFCLSFGASANATTENIKTANPVNKQLVVETSFVYTVSPYTNGKIILRGSGSDNFNYLTPESALVSYLTSFQIGSYARMRQSWTIDSLRLMDQIDKKTNVSTEERFKTISEKYRNSDINLKNRIVYDKFVLIDFELRQLNELVMQDTLAFVKDKDDQWRLTQELAGIPILANWNAASGRIRLPPLRNFLDLVNGNR